MIRYLLPSLLLVGSGSLTAATGTTEQKDVRAWLDAMTNAVHSLNYEGTFVYLHDNQLESMRVVHTVSEAGERERLISLNGTAREVVRDNASVTCITPDSSSVSISRRAVGGGFRAVFTMELESLASHYEFRFLEDTRIAGQAVKVVGILPRDEFRYGYGLYLHEGNSLPLKTDMLDSAGKPVSQIMFTNLRVSSEISDESDTSLDGKEHYGWVNQKPLYPIDKNDQKRWVFENMPDGFTLRLHSSRSGDGAEEPMEHFLFSDGLASVSVYVERLGSETGLQGGSQMGAVNAHGREVDGYQVTAVGAVPAITVATVASAIRAVAR